MRPDDPNLPLLILIAGALGEIREELVFVGGCASGLLLDEATATDVRATQDVDAIVEATTLAQFYRVEDRLPACGFVRDVDSGVICRWRHKDTGALFDLMPTDPAVLGFANRWYPEAVRTASSIALKPDLPIQLISAPAFVATKLEAFATRGRSDFMVSHDLEDVLNVVEGREALADELEAALPEMRLSVQKAFRTLLADENFIANLEGLLSDGNLRDLVLRRLREIAA